MYVCHRNTKTWQNLSNTGSLIPTATHEQRASEKRSEVQKRRKVEEK